jgi:PleD family two-component response regulator
MGKRQVGSRGIGFTISLVTLYRAHLERNGHRNYRNNGECTTSNRWPQYPRVLIAEDNPVNQMATCRLLKKLGYGSDIVPNGLAVLGGLDHISYHIILMDCQMPEMDGYEATRRICTRGGE